ncbi:MAG: hypothetical protein QOF32_26 [Gammaproteobacteria bacterium]|jgi:hypothetical protein|nr:hypothetical protein [Gammaproteobacteria bacterium]
MEPPDDLEEYLRGASALSRQYRREYAPTPPHALDRRVRWISRGARRKSPCLAPLAFAASVLLSVALVLAIVFGPQTAKHTNDAPRLVRVAAHASPNASLDHRLQLYSTDPQRAPAPTLWLTEITALRRAGRHAEADAELRRFRHAYPAYPLGELATRP